jgi:hypothetical protein
LVSLTVAAALNGAAVCAVAQVELKARRLLASLRSQSSTPLLGFLSLGGTQPLPSSLREKDVVMVSSRRGTGGVV